VCDSKTTAHIVDAKEEGEKEERLLIFPKMHPNTEGKRVLYSFKRTITNLSKNVFLSKEPYMLSKEPHIQSKEPYILSKSPNH